MEKLEDSYFLAFFASCLVFRLFGCLSFVKSFNKLVGGYDRKITIILLTSKKKKKRIQRQIENILIFY